MYIHTAQVSGAENLHLCVVLGGAKDHKDTVCTVPAAQGRETTHST